jgi:hypothetical protein
VTAAEHVTATGEEESCYEAILGVDTVRKTSNRLVVAFIHVGERGATQSAGVDEVEGSDAMLRRPFCCVSAHRGDCEDVCKGTEVASAMEVRCSPEVEVRSRYQVWKARSTTPRRETLMVTVLSRLEMWK